MKGLRLYPTCKLKASNNCLNVGRRREIPGSYIEDAASVAQEIAQSATGKIQEKNPVECCACGLFTTAEES